MNTNLLAAFLLVAPTCALASFPKNSISNELGFGAAQTDPVNPRAGQVMDTLSASVDLGSGWNLDLSTGVTLVGAIEGSSTAFASKGGNTFYFSPGVSWEATRHFTFGLALSVSPASQLLADTAIPNPLLPGETLDAQVSATTSASGLRLLASYDTAGVSDFETGIDLDIGVTHFESNQFITQIRTASGVVIDRGQYRQAILLYCSTHTCPAQFLGLVRNLLQNQGTPLNQTEVRLSVTETIHEDTDVGLAGSLFGYDRDPTDIGFYGLAAAGRGTDSTGSSPIAPLRWSLRPEVAHRFGNFSARLWLEHGVFVDDEGTTNQLGVKLQYNFSRSFRMWITTSWQRDRDAEDNVTHFNQVTLGAMWLF